MRCDPENDEFLEYSTICSIRETPTSKFAFKKDYYGNEIRVKKHYPNKLPSRQTSIFFNICF